MGIFLGCECASVLIIFVRKYQKQRSADTLLYRRTQHNHSSSRLSHSLVLCCNTSLWNFKAIVWLFMELYRSWWSLTINMELHNWKKWCPINRTMELYNWIMELRSLRDLSLSALHTIKQNENKISFVPQKNPHEFHFFPLFSTCTCNVLVWDAVVIWSIVTNSHKINPPGSANIQGTKHQFSA